MSESKSQSTQLTFDDLWSPISDLASDAPTAGANGAAAQKRLAQASATEEVERFGLHPDDKK